MINTPTHTDVLLGRGVAINRHRGNENFRAIVSKHASAYVTSTKKQKMNISKSIVDCVRTKLEPPGRFLAKNAETGLWREVEEKRALEKTAQALRDGGAPMRKQLREDISDPDLLDALFDRGGSAGRPPSSESSSNESFSKIRKRQRVISSSSTEGLSSDTSPPLRKKQRSNKNATWDGPVAPARRENPLLQQVQALAPLAKKSRVPDYLERWTVDDHANALAFSLPNEAAPHGHDSPYEENPSLTRARALSPGADETAPSTRTDMVPDRSNGSTHEDQRGCDRAYAPGFDPCDSFEEILEDMLDELKPFVDRGTRVRGDGNAFPRAEEEDCCRTYVCSPSPSDSACYSELECSAEDRFSDRDWDRFASLLMHVDL